MNSTAKLALFDALITYLISSSTAMSTTARSLVTTYPLSQSAHINLLNAALDSAKILLSKA